jgi:hypothetical protein
MTRFLSLILLLAASGVARGASTPQCLTFVENACPFGRSINTSLDFARAVGICQGQARGLLGSGTWMWNVGFENCGKLFDRYLELLKEKDADEAMAIDRENNARNAADKAFLDQFVKGLKP